MLEFECRHKIGHLVFNDCGDVLLENSKHDSFDLDLASQGVREDIFAFHLEQWIPLHFALTRVVCELLNAFVKLVIKLKMT